MSDIDDDALINDILNDSTAKPAQTNQKGKEMSNDPRDLVGRRNKTPVITKEEADKITEWKKMQKLNAEFKVKHGLQGYSMDEITAEGNKLVIKDDKVSERKAIEKELVTKAIEDEKGKPKAVAHDITGKTRLFGQEVPTQ